MRRFFDLSVTLLALLLLALPLLLLSPLKLLLSKHNLKSSLSK